MIELYDLAGADGRRFSPNCWRIKMALEHKAIPYNAIPVRFTEITSVADGKQKIVPILVDGATTISDSWHIAQHLEDAYADRPSLFGGKDAKAVTLFLQSWTADVVQRGALGLIVLDIYNQLADADKVYFRASREKRLGRTLEEVQAGRESRVTEFRASLQPVRMVLQSQAWLGGATPMYADYLVFGAFQWARMVSPFALLTPDDTIAQWFDRCLDLFGGLGRRALPSP